MTAAPLLTADDWCNCQAVTTWHPYGDTSFCPSLAVVQEIRRFIVGQVGEDMGVAMTSQAHELACRLARAQMLAA